MCVYFFFTLSNFMVCSFDFGLKLGLDFVKWNGLLYGVLFVV